ncbi:unnamed protein product [Coregonus sp. 'balchen']|nr:unnamed protein product [Coregonus sp. 'balchen']
MVVKSSYKPLWPDELELTRGEVILVLCKDEEVRWFGRLQNGQQGYFPASHVVDLSHQRTPGRAAAGGGPEGAKGEREGPILILKSQISLPNRQPQPVHQPVPQPQPLPQAHSSPSFLHRILSKHRRRSVCHGSTNTGYTAG